VEEKKKAYHEMQAKLSEVKGKDVKELDPEVERRYTLSSPLSLEPFLIISQTPRIKRKIRTREKSS
jgi:hypothetical protein